MHSRGSLLVRCSSLNSRKRHKVMEIINWRIVGHPLNWLTVFLMIFVAGIAIHLVMQAFGAAPAAATQAA